MQQSNVTFADFLSARPRDASRPDLAGVLNAVADACKTIAQALSQGALAGVLGSAGTENVQGETQKKLDLLANDSFVQQLGRTGSVAAAVSEEMADCRRFPEVDPGGAYLVLFDPLDGSHNVETNGVMGSIFSVLRCPLDAREFDERFALQPGHRQIAAGYALYGPSTLLILADEDGVNGFTLDRRSDEFILTHPALRVPAGGNTFAVNTSYGRFWEPPIERYVRECQAGAEGPRGQDFNTRWAGAAVAEAHRVLLQGGICLYPVDRKTKDRGGRLRLLYEASPLSYVIERAGGLASTGHQRVLEVEPRALHQRSAMILGAPGEVERLLAYYRGQG